MLHSQTGSTSFLQNMSCGPGDLSFSSLRDVYGSSSLDGGGGGVGSGGMGGRAATWVPPPRWPSGEASALRAADLGSIPAFAVVLFPGSVIPVTLYFSGHLARRLAL